MSRYDDRYSYFNCIRTHKLLFLLHSLTKVAVKDLGGGPRLRSNSFFENKETSWGQKQTGSFHQC